MKAKQYASVCASFILAALPAIASAQPGPMPLPEEDAAAPAPLEGEVPVERVAEVPLPGLPPRPSADILGEVPECQNDYLAQTRKAIRANLINACILTLDDYFANQLQIFSARMKSYRERLTALYDDVNMDPAYSYEQRRDFYGRILDELTKSSPGGEFLDQHRIREGQYRVRRATLVQAFCSTVTCL